MRRAFLAAAVCAAVTSLLVGTPPAAAMEEDPILITAPSGGQGQTYTVEYPAGTLAVNDASGEFHTPEDCEMLPSCAYIPMLVDYPEGYDRESEEYFITVTVDWEAGDVSVPLPGRPAGQDEVHAQGNDLDNYFYVAEQDAKGAKVFRKVAQAATANNPEKARWLGGDDEYALVIVNWIGVNRGFTLTITTTPATFGDPFEDLGTGFRPADGSSSGSLTSGPADVTDFDSFEPGPAASAPRTSGAGPEPVFATNPVGLPVIGADGLDTFGAFGGSTDEFEASLDGEAPQLFQPARELGAPEDVPGGLIAFWLGVVPLVLAAAAGAWFWRRRPAALSFVAPTTVAT